MATATHGSSIIFPSEAFDPLLTLKSVQEEQATALYGVPTMFLAYLELLQDRLVPYEGFEYLRTGIAAGSNIPSELMKKLHKTLNLTELSKLKKDRHDIALLCFAVGLTLLRVYSPTPEQISTSKKFEADSVTSDLLWYDRDFSCIRHDDDRRPYRKAN